VAVLLACIAWSTYAQRIELIRSGTVESEAIFHVSTAADELSFGHEEKSPSSRGVCSMSNPSSRRKTIRLSEQQTVLGRRMMAKEVLRDTLNEGPGLKIEGLPVLCGHPIHTGSKMF
jgi:hypothetical protein